MELPGIAGGQLYSRQVSSNLPYPALDLLNRTARSSNSVVDEVKLRVNMVQLAVKSCDLRKAVLDPLKIVFRGRTQVVVFVVL